MIHPLSRLPISLIVAMLLLCSWPGGAAEGASTPQELLARYRAFVDGLRTIRFDSLEKMYQKGGPFPDWTWTKTFRSSFARAGDRWRVRIHEVGFNYYERPLPMDSEREHVFDGASYLIVIRDDRAARDLPNMDQESAQRRLKEGRHEQMRMDVSAELEKPPAAHAYAVQDQTGALYGYIAEDNLFVEDLLRQQTSRLTARNEAIDGRPCEVLEGVTSGGTLTLWLDPAAEYAPLRMRMWKKGNDLMAKTPMRLQKALDFRWARPNLPVRQYELQVDYQQKPIDGRVAIAGYVRRDRYIYEGGSEFAIRIESSLDHIRFDPKPEELEPTLPIPEETRVHIRNGPALRAKWSGGKLVLGYDKPTVTALKANWVSEQNS